jgi:DNA-binding winged helix-turn-helix (wHTH) protein
VTEVAPSRGVVRFATFEVDLANAEVRKHGFRIRLQDQPFRVLQILLEHPGELVTREELQRQIWPADTFVDFEKGLNNAVKRLRDALGDSAGQPRIIETHARRGYRFIAPVETQVSETPGSTEVRSGPSISSTIPSGAQVAPQGYGTRTKVVASALVVAVGLLLTLSLSRVRERLLARPSPPRIQSLAVLPLENLSTDTGQDFFADGVTEELITDDQRSARDFQNVCLAVQRYQEAIA